MMKQSELLRQDVERLKADPEVGPDAPVVKDFERQLASLRKAESRESAGSQAETVFGGTRPSSSAVLGIDEVMSADLTQLAIDSDKRFRKEV